MNLTLRKHSLSFRLASTQSDLPAIVELARSAHEESRFSYMELGADKVRKIAMAAFGNQKRVVQKKYFFHVTLGIDFARTHKPAKRTGFQFVGDSYAKIFDNLKRWGLIC